VISKNTEMTFTLFSGIAKWDPPEYNKILGDLINLETLKNNKPIKI